MNEIETDRKTGRRVLRVTVFAPRSPKPMRFEWKAGMLVSEAAAEAAEAFGYAGGTPGLAKDDALLDPDQSLAAVGVKSGDKLELVDRGGGV